MYIIMVYDIEEERVNKVLKIGRKYLTWVQNSVLEGLITEAKFEKLKIELQQTLDEEKDSIIFYLLKSTTYLEKQVLGIQKGGSNKFV